MNFLTSSQLAYLNAMGITVWQSNPLNSLSKTNDTSIETQHENCAASLKIEKAQSNALFQFKNEKDTWQTLATDVAQCQLCTLCTTRTQTVFGEGNKNAQWLFIGEAPGQKEDEQGRPFVGDAGQLLTEMLRAINLTRDDVFIANILKCRPPNNRDPQPFEIQQCRRYLNQQIKLVSPKIIIAVGRIAAQTLLDTQQAIGTLRKKVHSFDEIPMIVIYHPAYLLRSPIEKRKTWQDLQFAMATFNTL